jgi:uncharacterized membrane protein YgcG
MTKLVSRRRTLAAALASGALVLGTTAPVFAHFGRPSELVPMTVLTDERPSADADEGLWQQDDSGQEPAATEVDANDQGVPDQADTPEASHEHAGGHIEGTRHGAHAQGDKTEQSDNEQADDNDQGETDSADQTGQDGTDQSDSSDSGDHSGSGGDSGGSGDTGSGGDSGGD